MIWSRRLVACTLVLGLPGQFALSSAAARAFRLGVAPVGASLVANVKRGNEGRLATYAAPRWSVVPTPTATTTSQLHGVSCVAAAACVAVGDVGDPTAFQGTATTLAEHWNGSSWSLLRTPNPVGATKSTLNGVSCASRVVCTAVGWSGTDSVAGGLAERWNGHSWSVQTTPNPTPEGRTLADLLSVSCASATSCLAVGYYYIYGVAGWAFAERWDGVSWSVQAIPKPAGARDSVLASVSCTSATACIAVGNYETSSAFVGLAVRWNGAQWSIQATANPTGAIFSGVSCTSVTACTAVGERNSFTSTLAERWNGQRWSSQPTPSPNPTGDNNLVGVSCVSTSACTAVGSTGDHGTDGTLAERWNGLSWSVQDTPNPAPQNVLTGDACPTTTNCSAVGNKPDGVLSLPLAERYS